VLGPLLEGPMGVNLTPHQVWAQSLCALCVTACHCTSPQRVLRLTCAVDAGWCHRCWLHICCTWCRASARWLSECSTHHTRKYPGRHTAVAGGTCTCGSCRGATPASSTSRSRLVWRCRRVMGGLL
jgi:hypothetical protein